MGKSQKPRKAYNRDKRAIHVPMMGERHGTEATSLHLHIEALCAAPTRELFNATTKKLAGIISAISYLRNKPLGEEKDATSIALRTGLLTLDAVCKRYEASGGKLFVSKEEAFSLKRASIEIDRALQTIPVNVLDAAGIAVEWEAERKAA